MNVCVNVARRYMCVCVLHTKLISAAEAIKFERQVALLEARIAWLSMGRRQMQLQQHVYGSKRIARNGIYAERQR